MTTRIYVLLARSGESAVVFRRGPAKQVLVLRWDLRDDTIQEGQWLKGHVYERRCDLSPDGEHLVYFAAKCGRRSTRRSSIGARLATSLGRADWADFDSRGDLLFAKNGRIFRAACDRMGEPRELFDLRARRFTQRTSPPWARQWSSQRPRATEPKRRR